MSNAKIISISIYPAQLKELDKLCKITDRSRSALIQDAVTVLINTLGEKNEVDKTVDGRIFTGIDSI